MAWPTESGSMGAVVSPAAFASPTGVMTIRPTGWRHSLTYSIVRHGSIVTVTATSNLAGDGSVWYHWFLDGSFMASSQSNVYSVFLQPDEQARVDVLDSVDPDYDPIANAPVGYPARKSVYWYRSFETDIDFYRVDQNKASAGWTEVGRVPHSDSLWAYSLFTPRLTDLTSYEWRVMPVDLAGNDGTATTFAAETIVRTPDAPEFTMVYDEGTDKITFA